MTDAETQRAAADSEFTQGDIFLFDQPDSDGGLPLLGVVINADCDLANNKTDGVIAYLPLYTFEEYLSRFWAADHVEKTSQGIVRRALELAKIDEVHSGDLFDWIDSDSPDQIAEALRKVHQLKDNVCQNLRSQLIRLAICRAKDRTPLEKFYQLCRLDNDPEAIARKQIIAAKKAMGDGHFFISDLVEHGAVGFVIRMRRIYTIDQQDCFTSLAAQRAHSDGTRRTAHRFASLTPLYRFKLAQLFAHQFSRIGLPDEITALSELAVESLVSHVRAQA